LADVVLPAQAYIERDGSYTSGERRVQRFYPAVPPRGEARADYAITAAVAAQAGVDLEGTSTALVMERIASSLAAFSGITYQGLAEVHAQEPIIGRADLYYGGTSYMNSQGLGMHLGPGTKKA
jgi:NADH-quinone oxidoreductase subunit G